MEAPSLLEVGVGLAIVVQAWVAIRLYRLQREIEKDRRRIDLFVAFEWKDEGSIVIAFTNASRVPIMFYRVAITIRDAASQRAGRMTTEGNWLLHALGGKHEFGFDREEVTSAIEKVGLLAPRESIEVAIEFSYFAHGKLETETHTVSRGGMVATPDGQHYTQIRQS